MHGRHAMAIGLAGLVPLAFAPWAGAADYAPEAPTVQVSGDSPIKDCTAGLPQSGTVYDDSEVEPYVAVNPADPDNLVAAWQQDRYSNGGSRGLVTAHSTDGGATWTVNDQTHSSLCTGGTAANGGDYERASDPWVTFSPDGTAYLMSLSIDDSPEAGGFEASPNAMLVMKSEDGGATWGEPTTLRRDDNPNVLNDKNTMTADPNDSAYAYAVWDRLVAPPGEPAPSRAFDNALGYAGPTWFARTTDGGDTWEPAREIFDPGAVNQTIGNQIVVLPDGTLVNVFDLIHNFSNRQGTRGLNVAAIRSEDRGETWDRQATIIDSLQAGRVTDPDDGDPVRTGDIIPEVAVDPNSGAIYVVWQDSRFDAASSVAMSMSTDGGLTWSETIEIDQSPAGVQSFTPMVKVADAGTVAVSYYDFRYNTDDPDTLPTDQWLVHCDGGCGDAANWTQETRVTESSFDMERAPVARGYFTGDYEGLEVDGGEFLPLWSMPHGSDPSSVFIRRFAPTG